MGGPAAGAFDFLDVGQGLGCSEHPAESGHRVKADISVVNQLQEHWPDLWGRLETRNRRDRQ